MLPDIGSYHPQIVHFVIALLVVGVVLRWISLSGRVPFTGPAAATLLLLGTLAAIAAVKSGTDAHGPVERVPGARGAVEEHEEWGERTRNLFIAIGTVEVLALLLRGSKNHQRLLVASAVLGLAGLWVVYETGEHGGELVYSYAGGVGTAYGEPDDVSRLLTAGLYNQSRADRAAGRSSDAARLIEEMKRRHPDDFNVALLEVESLIVDRKDGGAALAALAKLQSSATRSTQQRIQIGLYTADAQRLMGDPQAAQATLDALAKEFPGNRRIQQRLAEQR